MIMSDTPLSAVKLVKLVVANFPSRSVCVVHFVATRSRPMGTRVLLCPLLLAAPAAALAPYAFQPLPVGSVTPKGWLLKQLTLQADGLSGHLAQFWNDVLNSVWKGGSGDGGLHERTPYWLNGVVPLAFLLRNAGVEQLDPVLGIYKVWPVIPHRTRCHG